MDEDGLSSSGILSEAFMPYYQSESLVNTIVSGPYDREQPSDEYLLGSKNQKILTWDGAPLLDSGPRVEVRVGKDGKVLVTGFPSKESLNELKSNFKLGDR